MPYTTQRFTIGPDDAGRRLDRILRALYADKPLSFVYRLFREGSVRLDGKRAEGSTHTAAGDVVEVRLLSTTPHPGAASGPVDRQAARRFQSMIILETADLVVINKPAGILTHGPDGIDTLARAYFAERMALSLAFVPAPLHRLDRNTSGALAVSASLKGAMAFSEALRTGLVRKTYLALLEGDLATAALWEDSMERDTGTRTSIAAAEGKTAVAHAWPLIRCNGYTLASIELRTGRTHQIRAQAAWRGHALAGDVKYGGRPFHGSTSLDGGYFLHCMRLATPPGVGSTEGLNVIAPPSSQAIQLLQSVLGQFPVAVLNGTIINKNGNNP